MLYNNALKVDKIIGKFCDSYEIIIVNDGSKDNTKTEIKKAVEQRETIKMISYVICNRLSPETLHNPLLSVAK